MGRAGQGSAPPGFLPGRVEAQGRCLLRPLSPGLRLPSGQGRGEAEVHGLGGCVIPPASLQDSPRGEATRKSGETLGEPSNLVWALRIINGDEGKMPDGPLSLVTSKSSWGWRRDSSAPCPNRGGRPSPSSCIWTGPVLVCSAFPANWAFVQQTSVSLRSGVLFYIFESQKHLELFVLLTAGLFLFSFAKTP